MKIEIYIIWEKLSLSLNGLLVLRGISFKRNYHEKKMKDFQQFQDRNGITNEYQWNVLGSFVERKAACAIATNTRQTVSL